MKTASSVRLYLQHQGFQVDVVNDGRRGLERAREPRYDLLILDLMLPGLDGMELCRILRTESELPILMLTARTTTGDRVAGLESGADDYLAKPFSMRELTARVRAILKRTDRREVVGPATLRLGRLEIDLAGRQVKVGGASVTLTPSEFDILAILARSPGRVFRRDELIRLALPPGYEGQERTVDVHIKNLRRKIESHRDRPGHIRTVFGIGYRFDTRVRRNGEEKG